MIVCDEGVTYERGAGVGEDARGRERDRKGVFENVSSEPDDPSSRDGKPDIKVLLRIRNLIKTNRF